MGPEPPLLQHLPRAHGGPARRGVDRSSTPGGDRPRRAWRTVAAAPRVGIHTGVAFVGAVGKVPSTTVTALGDVANVAARLASSAGPGELLVTDTAAAVAGVAGDRERRYLDLKGKSETVPVVVLGVRPDRGRTGRGAPSRTRWCRWPEPATNDQRHAHRSPRCSLTKPSARPMIRCCSWSDVLSQPWGPGCVSTVTATPAAVAASTNESGLA